MSMFARIVAGALLALALVSPAQARFVSVDPVPPDQRNGENFNRYHYANGSPYVFSDPDGRLPILIPIIFGVTAYATSNYANAPARGAPTMSMAPADQAAAALPPGRFFAPLKIASNASNSGRYTPGGKFSRSTKKAVAERAASQCEYCATPTVPAQKSAKGVSPPRNEAATDHVEPRSKGGTNSPDNAAHACRDCNTHFSDKPKPHPRENP